MRDSKRKACPDVAASRQAAGMETADKSTSQNPLGLYHISGGPSNGQYEQR